jgi:hypothetical protein
MRSTRQQSNFTPQEIVDWDDVYALAGRVTNLIHVSEKPGEQWIVETTKGIGDWRAVIRTTHMRWRIAIDALLQAAEDCSRLPDSQCFSVTALRAGERGAEEIVLGEWSGEEAASNHCQTAQLLPAYGIADILGAWEETQFAMYRIFLNYHPQALMKGEHKNLRPIYYSRHKNAAGADAWHCAWKQRLDEWQRRKLYDGLGKIFLGYMYQTGLKRPSMYHRATIEDWADNIEAVAELRNLITHGGAIVSEKLGAIGTKPASMGFDFVVGEPLRVELRHLKLVECFFDQLLSAINLALIEKVRSIRQTTFSSQKIADLVRNAIPSYLGLPLSRRSLV